MVFARMTSHSMHLGGIADYEMRARVAILLRHLLDCASKGPHTIFLSLDRSAVAHPWPRKPSGRLPAKCTVAEGRLIAPRLVAGAGDDAECIAWAAGFGIVSGGDVDIKQLVASLVEAGREGMALLAQLVSQLAICLDAALVASEASLMYIPGLRFAPDGRASDSNAMCDLQLETYLRREVRAFKASGERPTLFLSISPDKSRVGNLGITNVTAVNGNGFGMLLPPQALIGWVYPVPSPLPLPGLSI